MPKPARHSSLPAIACALALVAFVAAGSASFVAVRTADAQPGPRAAAPSPGEPTELRVVSLNPSLTAILLALGARDTLVGVDAWSHRQRPEVADLPEVGGLFDPSLESVVALEPDLVVLTPSVEQRDFRGLLENLGIRVAAFENIGFDEVLANIEDLGALVHREQSASERVAAILATRAAVASAVASRARVRCIVILQRDPVFVVGSASFIDEMLDTAGCTNLGRELGDGYPRAALEWVIAQAPDVVIDTSRDASPGEALAFWRRWKTLPAVASDRVLHLDAEKFTLPGPALDEALRELTRALHGEEADAEIAAALGKSRHEAIAAPPAGLVAGERESAR